MKYFIDTADVAEIREAASWGLIDGVTTNPSLMAKTGRPYHDVLREICEIVTESEPKSKFRVNAYHVQRIKTDD